MPSSQIQKPTARVETAQSRSNTSKDVAALNPKCAVFIIPIGTVKNYTNYRDFLQEGLVEAELEKRFGPVVFLESFMSSKKRLRHEPFPTLTVAYFQGELDAQRCLDSQGMILSEGMLKCCVSIESSRGKTFYKFRVPSENHWQKFLRRQGSS